MEDEEGTKCTLAHDTGGPAK